MRDKPLPPMLELREVASSNAPSNAFLKQIHHFMFCLREWDAVLYTAAVCFPGSARPPGTRDRVLAASARVFEMAKAGGMRLNGVENEAFDWFKIILDHHGVIYDGSDLTWTGAQETKPGYDFGVIALSKLLEDFFPTPESIRRRAQEEHERRARQWAIQPPISIGRNEATPISTPILKPTVSTLKATTFVDIWELSKRLGLPDKWLKVEIKAGRLPHILIGRKQFFHFATVEQALLTRFLPVQTEAVDESNRPNLLASTG